MLRSLVSSPRAPCLGLLLGAALGSFYGGCHRSGRGTDDAPRASAAAAPGAPGPVARVTAEAATTPPDELSPSITWVEPRSAEVLPELGGEEAGSALPRTPLSAEVAREQLSSAWRHVTGVRLTEEGLSVILSHWALETGRGERMVGFNFGGLKGESPAGGSVSIWTRERRNAEMTLVRRRFRAYPSATAGARDYVKLLRQRYPRARRAVERGSVVDFVLGLADGGYFTDEPERYLRAMRSLSREFLEQAAERTLSPVRSEGAAPIAERDAFGYGREI